MVKLNFVKSGNSTNAYAGHTSKVNRTALVCCNCYPLGQSCELHEQRSTQHCVGNSPSPRSAPIGCKAARLQGLQGCIQLQTSVTVDTFKLVPRSASWHQGDHCHHASGQMELRILQDGPFKFKIAPAAMACNNPLQQQDLVSWASTHQLCMSRLQWRY